MTGKWEIAGENNRADFTKVIAFLAVLYYNRTCKKNLPFKNFFYITPYLIIYTPLEIPGSSPTGDFLLYNKFCCKACIIFAAGRHTT